MSEPVVACLLVAAQRHGEVQVLPAVQVKAGCGIVGDRFFSRSSRHPERNITLIEAEAIEAVAAELALPIPVTAPRRNVVTRGIRLNALMGKTFTIGPVTLQGIELCEPCVVLGIDPMATDEQIREAWLRQVRANHPDRLIAQGGVKVNGERLSDRKKVFATGETFLVQVGKLKIIRIKIT